jgi:hypothetical protein
VVVDVLVVTASNARKDLVDEGSKKILFFCKTSIRGFDDATRYY